MSGSPGNQLGGGSQVATPPFRDPGGRNWDYFKSTNKLHVWSVTDPMSSMVGIAMNTTGVTTSGGQLRAQPHLFTRTGVIEKLIIPIQVAALAAATPKMRVGIYDSNPNTLYPINKLFDSGDINADTTTTGGANPFLYGLEVNLTIGSPGVYHLVWTINAGFAASNGLMFLPQQTANTSVPWLGITDRAEFAIGWNNAAGVTVSVATRAGAQWVKQAYSYPSSLDSIFPDDAAITPMADGSGVNGAVNFGGTSQIKGGGALLASSFLFTPG